ncbi:sulfatase-like hydrolase/transferase [Cohnella thailandensis]|uniref:Sulfatase-like hydrolase/transferase n=1 Tax=Cohnella thailandensis TaxID=557557 RepID=A0A841SRQ3_9BACL|nr:sulfatase-like hydrolase/transferase [Cohnella thailandensis]MBB6632580.1 sulfatase-like hydrolase/transferase [Cohnella thailandensis]MBP1971874.1 membrane-anchored protein YejM (alkaline phosphatase superfamily) [Cohnella thailandensis]
MSDNRKNLIVLHLESLSNEIFQQERANLSFLVEVMSKSIVYENFFSTATSSLMALTDFLHGNDFEIDNSISFDELLKPTNYQENLFDLLNNKFYRTMGIGYPKIWRDDIKKYDMWSSNGDEFKWAPSFEHFILDIEDFIAVENNKPFAIYIWDILSHLGYSDAYKNQGKNFFERRSLGYRSVDETVRCVIEILEKYDLMKNTIIVGFGDHGDELWTHDLNKGFCHAIEPYTNIIKTPAFIYNADCEPSMNSDLVSLIDLRQTILSLLDITDESVFFYSGVDINQVRNRHVFSRNLLSNQRDSSILDAGPVGLRKSFSITNNHYHLIVSNCGMEMYAYQIDSTNHSNLLNFFDIDCNGEITFNNRGADHAHFKRIMQPDQIAHIIENYYRLREELIKRVSIRNDLIASTEKNLFNLAAFLSIRERKYIW